MAKLILLALLLIFQPVIATASDMYQIFTDMLTQPYVDNVSDLPPATNLKPDETLTPGDDWFEDHCTGDTQNNCVFGWFDILGFKNTVQTGDGYYIAGNLADSAIIQYKTYIRINGRYLFKDWIYDLQKYETNGNFCARLTATAVLYQIDSSGYISYDYPSQTFQKCIAKPKQYPQMSNNSPVFITIYNFSFEPKTTIRFVIDNSTKTTVSYHNNSLIHSRFLGHVEYTAKGVPFMNLSPVDSWDRQGDQVSHIGNEFMINGTADPKDIIVQASSPFETITLTNYSIQYVEPSPPVNAVFLPFVLVLSVVWLSTIKILRSIQL